MKYFLVFLEENIERTVAEDVHPCLFRSVTLEKCLVFSRSILLDDLIQNSAYRQRCGLSDEYANQDTRKLWMEKSYFVNVYHNGFFMPEEHMRYIESRGKLTIIAYKVIEKDYVYYYIVNKNRKNYVEQELDKRLHKQIEEYQVINVTYIEAFDDDVEEVKLIEWKNSN